MQKLVLPQFSQIDIDSVPSRVKEYIDRNLALLESQLKNHTEYTWENLSAVLDEADDELNRFWSPVSHLNSVMNNEQIREVYNACLPLFSDYGTTVGQHEGLYQALQSMQKSEYFKSLSPVQQRIIDEAIKDFRLAGVHLSPEKKEEYKAISQRLSKLTTKFEENLLDATNAWTLLITDEARLKGLPDYVIEQAKTAAESKGDVGYSFNLTFPSYYPVLTFAEDASFRQEMYYAYITRASECGPTAHQFDNTQLMHDILTERHALANLLGFDNYALLSLERKMAKTPSQVREFLEELAQKSYKKAKAEFQALAIFARENFGKDNLDPWDIAYYSEKMQISLFDFSQEDLRPYFPVNAAVNGMFDIVKTLYQIEIFEKTEVDKYHPDVRFFELYENGQVIGGVYMDLYAREKKRGGAWMDDCVNRRRNRQGDIQLPVAYLTCNFTGPSGDKPALFSHDEVITLFHEFGHCLHHLLTRIDYTAASGIQGVCWDAVELPSQFFENWCWHYDALKRCSAHVDTGEPLPLSLFEKVDKARTFQAAMQMIRQLEFSLFDFMIHENFDKSDSAFTQHTLDTIRKQYAVVPVPKYNRFAQSFSHIFAGGYAAGYYSYKWAEVLSSDAFSRFEEEGIFSEKAGHDFRETILALGGSQEPMDLFIAFRGREPKIDALLRHSGIAVEEI